MTFKYEIRQARQEELAELPELEKAAGQRFARIRKLKGLSLDVTRMVELMEACSAGHVWVVELAASSRTIGFAYASVLDGNLHLEEIDVLPEFGGKGIGAALVRLIADFARQSGYPAMTLTTFRDVTWNAPFYAKLGFHVLEPAILTPGLADSFREEERRGLPNELRVVMRLGLGD